MNKFMLVSFILFIAVSNLFSQSVSNKPNVILITIDTLRADSVGFNGSKKVQTPNLDALAAQGVNFTRTRAAVPLTLPSHASIMTGLYPVQHGVRDNGTARLGDEPVTLAEIFKQNGYRTAAFVGSFVLDHRFGLNQGFDSYDDAMPIAMAENHEAERNADAVHQAFSKWFKQRNDALPFFVWIHFYDPHAPYNPPEPFRSQYKNDPYSGEIAYTDFVVGKILNDLKSKGPNIIAVAGDHGEGLGEHQEQTHSLLIYNSTLHVPMILVADGIKKGSKYERLSRLIDLPQTLLQYANIPSKLSGSGISLKSAIENGTLEVTEHFSESFYPRFNLGWSDLKGVETEKYRYIDAPKPELYDLANDAGETQNVIQKNPQEARKLKGWIDQFYQKHSFAAKSSSPELDPETKEKLASLGYVSGSSASVGSSNIDPKDKIVIWNNIQKGIFLTGKGNYDAAIQIFEPISKTEKNIRIVYDNLCSLYMKKDQLQQAESCIQQAITNGVDFANLHLNLGEIYHDQKKYDVAEKEFRIALAMDELNVSAHYFLANSLRAAGKPLQAVAEYQKALEMNPRYIFAMNGLAMTYSTLKRDEEAFRVFNLAAEQDPQNPAAYFNLAIQAEKMNKANEAVDAYKKFLELADQQKFAKQRQKAQESIKKLRSN